jgi:hypothetical protein
MNVNSSDQNKVPQLKWAGLAGLFALPVAWWLIVMYIITPRLLPNITTPGGEINGYALNLISLAGYLFEFVLAIIVLRTERQRFSWPALRTRLNLRWGGWKTWILFLMIFIAAFALTFPLISASKITAEAFPPSRLVPRITKSA